MLMMMMMMMMIQHLLVAVLALLLHQASSLYPLNGLAPMKGAIEILLAFLHLAPFSPSNIATMGCGRGLKNTTNMNPIETPNKTPRRSFKPESNAGETPQAH